MAHRSFSGVINQVGTSTGFTDEPMSVVSGLVYEITDATKNLFDRDVVPVISWGGTPVAGSSVASIDYLTGRVTFASTPTGAVTITGSYMPKVEVLGIETFNVTINKGLADSTDIKFARENAGFQTRQDLLIDSTISAEGFWVINNNFIDGLLSLDSPPVVVDITVDNNIASDFIRGWYILPTSGLNVSIDGLIKETVELQLHGSTPAAISWYT